MAKTEHKLTVCGITQQLNPEYWHGWSAEEKLALKKDAQAIGNVICSRLSAAGYMPESLYCIIHDKDMRKVWDEHKKQYVFENKPPHVHIVVKFITENKKILSGTLQQIAVAVGVDAQYVEKAARGRYGYDNMLSYLTHIKYLDKTQYSPLEVYSTGVASRQADGSYKVVYKPYADIYSERREEWESGRAALQVQRAKTAIDTLEMQILLGEVTRNQILLTEELFNVYARNRKRCEDAFASYSEKKIAHAIKAMESGEFRLTVYFITGKSHSGKSVFTDKLAKEIIEKAEHLFSQNWSIYNAGASNPFDEYQGEEIMIMDDLRGASMTASDWLKLLDPDRVNVGSARYRNRKIACRVVIINSEVDVLNFFGHMKSDIKGSSYSETMDQFFRRILAQIIVYRIDDIRRLRIGHSREVGSPYEVEVLKGKKVLKMHHDFNLNPMDLGYEEALEYLSDLVMKRNNLHKREPTIAARIER